MQKVHATPFFFSFS